MCGVAVNREPRSPVLFPYHVRVLLVSAVMALVSVGCDRSPQSSYGFMLPKGNAEQGAVVFQEMQCHACHTIDGIEQLMPPSGDPKISVALGGKVPRIKTYGELVTAVINPSHRLAEDHQLDRVATTDGDSRMLVYNDFMTITELCDLVAFLQSKYEVELPPPTTYPPYFYY